MPDDRSFELKAERRFGETALVPAIGCPLYPSKWLFPGCRTLPLLRAEERSFDLEAETRTFDLVAE